MDEKRKAAFDFARDSTKQLLTLATGILTVTISLTAAGGSVIPDDIRGMLGWMWGLYLVSMVFGSWTLLALTGTLEPLASSTDEPSIRGRNITLPSILQVMTFLGATLVAVIVGIRII